MDDFFSSESQTVLYYEEYWSISQRDVDITKELD